MKKKLLIAVIAVGMSVATHAAQITGGISLAGGPITTDTGDLATATKITGFGIVTTTTASGSYGVGSPYGAVTPGTSVGTTTGFTFNPALPGPVNDVWSFVFGGHTYSFDLSSIQSVEQGTDMNGLEFLTVHGTGVLGISGGLFADTTGFYILTANGAASTFSFSSSNNALVPDGGMTVAMLGIALTGLGFIRRKVKV